MQWCKWKCQVCGWIYDEELGALDEGIPPGTRWEDVPEDWMCPQCGALKQEFAMVELEIDSGEETTEQELQSRDGEVKEREVKVVELGAAHQDYTIDAEQHQIASPEKKPVNYVSIIVRSGKDMAPRPSGIHSNDTSFPIHPDEHLLDDGLQEPSAVSRTPNSWFECLAAWWWGA